MPQTGPKTPEGKAKSSKNALKHGLTSQSMFVLDNENQEIWNEFLKSWTDRLLPRDEPERLIVEDIAHAQWRIRRARTWESGIMNGEMKKQKCGSPEAFKSLADDSHALDALHRYENRARRAFKQGMAALEQLRALAPTPAIVADPVPIHEPPVPAAVKYPTMPEHLQKEWDYLSQTIAYFHPYWHRTRMSEELQEWIHRDRAA